eukprot:1161606-Pelagomonas_calceolata.AAC.3
MLTVLSSRSCVFNSQPTHKEHHINKLNGPGFPVQSSTSRFGLGRRLEARTLALSIGRTTEQAHVKGRAGSHRG